MDGLHQDLRRRDAEEGAGLPGPEERRRQRLLRTARRAEGILNIVKLTNMRKLLAETLEFARVV